MFNLLNKYPVSIVSIICLLLFFAAGIFFRDISITPIEIQYFLITTLLFFLNSELIAKFQSLVLGLIFFVIYLIGIDNALLLLFAEIAMLGIVVFYEKNLCHKWIFAIIGIAFLFHLFYIQNTNIDIRQHDLNGILLYMRLIIKDGINWKNFDPWYMYYLFHQPLHFILADIFYYLAKFLLNSDSLALENLQYLSLFYVTITTIFFAGILFLVIDNHKFLYPALILLVFNPTLFLFSGYISDDTPVIFWSTFTVYFLLRWIKTNHSSDIVFSAIGFGLGCLTKLSLLLLVPAFCSVFLFKLLQDKENREKILFGISIFIIIAVPLSLLWIIRNHIFFDMQFSNIPDTSPAGQNFKYQSFGERLTDLSKIFTPFLNAPNFVDANMWLALVKTELFGEWDFSLIKSSVYYPAFFLYGLNIILKIFAFCGLITLIKNTIQNKALNIAAIFFAVLYCTIWPYAFKYSLDYPYVCSCDYRLFAQLMLPEVILIVFFLQQKENTAKIFTVFSLIYALLVCFIYTTIL